MVLVATPSKTTMAPDRGWRLIFFGLMIIAPFVAVLGIVFHNDWFRRVIDADIPMSTTTTESIQSSGYSSKQVANVQRETIQGVDVLFAEPSRKVEGILFVAHGCSHSNTDWFLGCDGCIGLPEERAIVEIGLNLNLVVVAVSSTNRVSKCWNINKDIERVGTVLKAFSKKYQTIGEKSLRIFAFGASSGGGFVSAIATPLKERYGLSLAGFLSQIAASQIDEASPCQVYITMNGDKRTDANAKRLIEIAASTGTSTRHIRIPRLPITSDFFASRVPEVSMEDSGKMTQALRNAGLLDEAGYLLENPRRSNWRHALATTPAISAVERDSLIADASPISEVMNLADGKHEITRSGVKEGLEFCLS